jgi:methyltransferase (TIGR00027 family)
MEDGKASFTAESVAAIRAVESAKPEGERLCYDPYARYFIGGGRDASGLEFWRELLSALDLDFPGIQTEVVLRTRYIDDYLKECIVDGITQLVILGAGYDSRAYRIDGLKGKVRVFEVDHPATQKVKTERLKEVPASLPDHVMHMPVDFHREKLNKRLSESGYDRKLKTLFIWEGVTMYLTAEAVDETLAFVADNSGRGTSIIFNYLVEPVGDGPGDPEMSWWTVKRRQEWLDQYPEIGERLAFGIPQGGVEDFLSKRGFHQVVNATCKDMRHALFTGANRKRRFTPLMATVHATVKPRG